jgi:NADPH-dependent 2,4-dienoyl-CoA reductase/sulfur reductase-like enzyme
MEAVARPAVAVVGAGPAGLSAAIQLAELGVEPLVLDEKPEAGGQLFKQVHKFFGSGRHMAGVRGFEIGRRLLERCRELGVTIRLDTAVWGVWPDLTVAAHHRDGTDGEGSLVIAHPRQLILATGASENSLAFPGWTLPGIMGAGAAQTLVNVNRVRPGRRALIVGAGNVGLIVAYQLMQAGIGVAAVVEATPQVGGYFVHAAKVRRMGVPFLTRHTVVSAEGEDAVRRCTVAALGPDGSPVAGSEKTFEVDLVCISVGLSPAVELPRALGLAMEWAPELGGHVPAHGPDLMAEREGVYVAGDLSGIEEASTAMEEGKLAAVTAAARLGSIPPRRAEELAQELQRGLRQLRAGPFGEAVTRRKAEIFERFARRAERRAHGAV